MLFEPLKVMDKTGQEIILRNAQIGDAENLIQYLKLTTLETPYLIREPDEVTLSLGQEQNFIQEIIDSDRELMIVATMDGKHVGNCSLMSVGEYKRYRHRCSIAIALYENLGFQQFGHFPCNMKYENGKYADVYWMMKKL